MVSKAADRSSRMRTDDLESAFAVHRASVTNSISYAMYFEKHMWKT